MLTVGSLFSGIGGIDLGLERTGHFRTIWFSEIDPYANRVLAKHWPNVPNLGNVKEIDFGQIERPDVLVGGYPCQPFSTAGKRQGEQDPRHLWPECLRALRILRPRYALFENVRGHVSLGFPRVLADLASIGFNAEWQVIPAAAVGAPHKRDRLFIVGYPDDDGFTTPEVLRGVNEGSEGTEKRTDETRELAGPGSERAFMAYPDDARVGTPASGMERQESTSGEEWDDAQHEPGRRSTEMAYPAGGRFQECQPKPETTYDFSQGGTNLADAEGSDGRRKESHGLQQGRGETTKPREQSSVTRPEHGGWEVEPDVGRVANGVSARVDRLRALGNAVVPQVAEYIGYLIADHANA